MSTRGDSFDPLAAHKPVAPRPTRQEAIDAVLVAADALEEAGDLATATRVREAAQRPWISASDVLLSCGMSTRQPDGGRRSGRTTRMLAEAVAAAARGSTVEIVGHTPRYSADLKHAAVSMAHRAGLPRAAARLQGIAAAGTVRLRFVDHYTRELQERP